MTKYTHEQAVEAAERLTSLYGFHCVVCDPSDDAKFANWSFVGIHVTESGPCVCAVDEEADIEALRKLARIIVQTEQDLSQEEDPNLDPTYANRMLMQASEPLTHNAAGIPLEELPFSI